MRENKYTVSKDVSIRKAMELINLNSLGIIFIVDENGCLIGAASDGDVRRHLLNNGNLDDDLWSITSKNPKYLPINEEHRIDEVISEYGIKVIPIVGHDRSIISIYANNRFIDVSDGLKEVPVVIMAGGLGTRLYPYTKILPKPLIPVGDTPIVERIMNQFERFGCEDFAMVVNYKKEMIMSYFNDSDKKYKIYFVLENIPLGTAGGLSIIRGRYKKPIFVTNCDTLIIDDYNDMYRQHLKSHNVITMIGSKKAITIPYGVIRDKDGRVNEIEEKPTTNYVINTGMYIINPEVIDAMKPNEKITMPEIIQSYMDQGQRIGVYTIDEDSWHDMGQLEELEEMRKRFE